MTRKMIKIDEDQCIGCGACAATCSEGVIDIVDGKAKLLADDYCDGMEDCVMICPTGAISFVEEAAPAYDESAIQETKEEQ